LRYTRDGEDSRDRRLDGRRAAEPGLVPQPRGETRGDGRAGVERFQADARVTDPAERRRLYDRHAEVYPGFRDYEARTERVIPVIVLKRVPAAIVA
jgi:hypothetical protein